MVTTWGRYFYFSITTTNKIESDKVVNNLYNFMKSKDIEICGCPDLYEHNNKFEYSDSINYDSLEYGTLSEFKEYVKQAWKEWKQSLK